MSTGNVRPTSPGVASATLAFVAALDAWAKRASLEFSGERMTRLRLLNELHCNGPRKMADLASTLGVTPRAITAIVDALEAEDQVRRVGHATDRRVTMIEITGGAATVEQQFRALGERVERLFADVDPADREGDLRAIAAVMARLDTV
jgi:DNA-binding MarR family transcriptional regulator